ncbi:MAG: DUF4349 domain-containing protein [Actinomycetota bacterium]
MTKAKWFAVGMSIVIAGLTACAGGGGSSAELNAGGGGSVQKGLVARSGSHEVAGSDTFDGINQGTSAQTNALAPYADSASGSTSALPEIGPRVIKNASLALRVDRGHIQDAVHSIGSTAEGHRGFVVSTDFGGTDAKGGSVTVRVPASEFEATLSELEQLGHVTRQSVSGHDVSQEFIDLQARLKNASAQEQVLLRLMDRAQSIEDTIRVQQQLEGVQLTIERLKGRIRYLNNETAFSTISVALAEAGVAPARPVSTLARAWAHARDVAMNVVSGVVVTAGFLIPVLVLMGFGFLVYRLVRPRLRFGSSS